MRLRVLAVLLFVFTAGCAIGVGRGVVHTVKSGETLWRICQSYDADLQEVAEFNDIQDPSTIIAGTRIFIPHGKKARRSGSTRHYKAVPASVEKYSSDKLLVNRGKFRWPVSGDVSSRFGLRNGLPHDGIDISAPEDTPVKAAANGTVAYVSRSMRGYGNIVILEHEDDYYTVYAHNKKNFVKKGEDVAKGEVIATVGNSGNASGYHLHFEVRKGKTVRNPLFFLP